MPVTSTHPAYDAEQDRWRRCRDVIAGSDAVKAAREKYLPMLPGQALAGQKGLIAYNAYLLRALFYNASGRTVDGLVGTVFRKPPARANIPALVEPQLRDVTLDDVPLEAFAQTAFREVMAVGRAGVLLDMAMEGSAESRPYWIAVKAEGIVNWQATRIRGDRTLTRVVLYEAAEAPKAGDVFVRERIPQYRECFLDDDGKYTVQLWRRDGQNQDRWIPFEDPVRPTRRGERLPWIPFVFFGPTGIAPDVEPSLLLDLVDVNLSHYRSSADLEHGRHFTALPTPWIAGYSSTDPLVIGAGTAWTFTDPQTKVGMLEFTGSGLGTLEKALEDKRQMMASLGGRLLEVQPTAQETAHAVSLRVAGEHSALRTAAINVGLGLSQALFLDAWWSGVDETTARKATLDLNQQFLETKLTALEITALMGLYQAGGISFETLYYNLQRGEVARPGVEVEEERALVDADAEAAAAELAALGAPPPGGQQGGARGRRGAP